MLHLKEFKFHKLEKAWAIKKNNSPVECGN